MERRTEEYWRTWAGRTAPPPRSYFWQDVALLVGFVAGLAVIGIVLARAASQVLGR
ncbi:MAG TPA: hypothetical protein VF841_17270 [Anaeromyxobacter sp.]